MHILIKIGFFFILCAYTIQSYAQSKTEINNIRVNPQELSNKAFNYIKTGVFYQEKKDYEKTIEYFLKALKVYQQYNDAANVAKTYYRLATIHGLMADGPGLYYYANICLKLFEQLNDKNGILNAYICKAGAYNLNNNLFDSSIIINNKALKIAIELNDTNAISICNNNLAHGYLELQDYKNAIKYALKSIELEQKTHSNSLTRNYFTLGMIYFQKEDDKNAIIALEKALEVAKIDSLADENLKVMIMYNLSQSYYAIGKIKKAYDLFFNAKVKEDSLNKMQTNKNIYALEKKYEYEKQRKEITKLNFEKKIQELKDKENLAKIKQQRIISILFIVLAITILIFLVVLLKQYKKLQVSNKELGLQYIKTHETLEENKKLQKVLETELDRHMQISLRKLMNPHFIFNSLNSIQAYILSNDKLNASVYLAKFANLMRKVLNNSQENLVSLATDLSTLSLYVELEAKRFEGKFTYDFIIDPTINQENVLIPPLLFQPYIENAIWHGLMHQTQTGKLIFTLKAVNQKIICEIIDNGIGRKKSAEINSKKTKKEKSYGTQITEKRIELINTFNKSEIYVKFFDLEDDEKNALGTKVEITLPLLTNDTATNKA